MNRWRKKLKHPIGFIDMLVVAAAGFLITAGLFLSSVIGREPLEESTDTVRPSENMGEDLEAVSDYLTQIHTLVNYNSGQLEEISSYSDSYHTSLGEFSGETIRCIEDNITKISAYLKELEGHIAETEGRLKEESSRQDMDSLLLSEQVSKLHQKVEAGEQSIKELLESLQDKGEVNAGDIRGELDRLNGLIAELGKGTEDLFQNLQDELKEMQGGDGEKQEEVVTFLTAIQEGLIVNAQNNITMMQENFNQINEIILEEMERIQVEITGRIEELSHTFTVMDQQIIQTQEMISGILSISKDDNEEGFRQTVYLIGQVELALTDIKEDINEANQELSEMIGILQTEGESRHGEMLSVLSGIQDGLQALINSQTETLNDSINNLKIYMEGSMSTIDQKLESLFLYVSNGKKLLASTLLTKGVSVREDATFNEIYKAILDIPQQLLIGVQEIPGTISYDYHYHVDKDGTMPHTITHSVKGGCYNNSVYHAHQSSCYKDENTKCSCSGYSQGDFLGNHAIDGWPMWKCKNCSHANWQHDSGKCTITSTNKVLICGKATSTAEYYSLSCGLSDGQIVGAYIIYGGTVQSTGAAISIQDLADDTESEGQEEGAMEPAINEQPGTEETMTETEETMAETEEIEVPES